MMTSAPRRLRLPLLVLQAQAGSEAAFATLLQEYDTATRRYLTALVGDDADDIQQELWIAVHRRLGELADPGAFRAWLFRAARHRAIDWLRKLKRERELFVDLDAEAMSIEQLPENGWDQEALTKAVARLPPIHREVVVLRYLNDLSYGEIALATGIPIGTVRSRLHHAHCGLRNIMTPNFS